MFNVQQVEQVPVQFVPEKAHLKPERVQEMLKMLPGWKLGAEGQSISRRRNFTSLSAARAYVARVSKLATAHGQPVKIALSGKRVDLTLPGRTPKHPNGARLTMDVVNLASQIG